MTPSRQFRYFAATELSRVDGSIACELQNHQLDGSVAAKYLNRQDGSGILRLWNSQQQSY